jgi:hypothetical protein
MSYCCIITRNTGLAVKVSLEDRGLAAAYGWYEKQSDHKSYVAASIRRGRKVKTIRLHRLIAQRMGLLPKAGRFDVHHKDSDRGNCTRENLDVMSHITHAREHARRRYGA